MLRRLFLLLLVAIPGLAFGQGAAGIQGTITDQKGEGIPGASIIVTQGGIKKAITGTDVNGQYEAKPLDPGVYDVTINSAGNPEQLITAVEVSSNSLTPLNYRYQPASSGKVIGEVKVIRYKRAIIDPRGPLNAKTGEEIDRLADQTTAGVVLLGPNVHGGGRGTSNDISIGGGRTTGNNIIVDGVQYTANALGSTTLPPGTAGEIKTYASGVPAQYGDASGGVIVITSRGIASRFSGNVRLEKSLEGFGHNQGSFSISAPLLRRYTDSARTEKTPVLGFRLGGDFLYDKDASPNYGGNYILKDDVRARLEANPLIAVASPTGSPTLAYAAEGITADDLKKVDQRPNGSVTTVKLLPKLDYQLNQNVSITLGSSLYGVRNDVYDRLNSIFSPDGGRQTTGFSGVGYLRFTQKFGQGGAAKDNTVSNAFYTVQVDYKKDLYNTEDKNLKQNTFDYGYLGKFHETYAPVYFGATDTASGKAGVTLFGYQPVSVEFTPSDKNPILAHYTQDYLNFHGNSNTTNALSNSDGYFLRNGGRPNDALGIWRNVGSSGTSWSKRNEDQISLAVDASFDYKTPLTKHTINFGLYYQQRNYRNYAIGGAGLWGLMRQLERNVNDGRTLDNSNPTFIKNGVTYTLEDVRAGRFNPSPQDTIMYQLLFKQAAQGKFDRSLRAKLGKGVHDYINVDDLDPSTFSVDMFSADEILNSGSSYASYQGYDYTGKLQTGNVNFQDFWSKKENGEYTRPIAAYRPNYIAGYISDFIQFKKDVKFNIGMRVERFDNNTKMLKDPYSLYGARTVADNDALGTTPGTAFASNQLNGKTPANIGSDYTVYVSGNNGKNPEIIGYRNGDDFFDPYGRAVEDPTFIQNMYAKGGVLQPYLQSSSERITDSNFNSNNSFTDYKPQIDIMPRINFSFPINDKALFYAHYDVLVQRPETQTEAYSTPYDYYFLSQNASQIIGNTALKPQKTIDYEVGFQQQLTAQSGITITAFYKERKDQIQVRPYLYAYPTTYYTYGNRDFSTTKGFSLSYDLRRIGNISMGINYTLQFAEGTGSDTKSANGGDATFVSSSGLLQNFISASLPNLRSPFALGYDSRHNINANIDYRYLDNEGPVVGGKHIFENMGANLTFFTRSGEPYTRYQQTQLLLTGVHNNSVIAGDVNGSRLPWHYSLNLRVDKEFAVNFNKGNTNNIADRRKSGGLSMTAYVSVTNLLNTRDVLSVYGYTGRAGDDGYLTSPQGSLASQSPSLISSQAYIDQYSIRANDPAQLNAPRRVNLGLQVNF